MMNDLNELMKQLQALEAAVADTTPQPQPQVQPVQPAAPPGLAPEMYAQLRALQQGVARPMPPITLPDNLAGFEPTKMEQALRGEIQLVNRNVASLHSQFQTLAIAMQAMVRKVSAALEDSLRVRQRASPPTPPRRRQPPPIPLTLRKSVRDLDDWERTETRVDIPILSAVEEPDPGPVIPRMAETPPAASPSTEGLATDVTQPSRVFRSSSSPGAPEGGRALNPNAGGDLTK